MTSLSATLGDMRILRLARHLTRPASKADMSGRKLPLLRLALRDKSKSVLFATFPKSGWNWSADVIDYAIHKHFAGEYQIDYADAGGHLKANVRKQSLFSPADARGANQEPLRSQFPQLDIDYRLHTHGYWKESPLWGLDAAKTVIVARNIPTMLYSYYRSRRTQASFEAVIEDHALARAIRFYNSWARFARRPDSRLKVFHYEQLRREPVAGFDAMIRYTFGADLPEGTIREAVDYFGFEKQKAREWQFAKDESRHFHFRGALDYSDMVAPETRQRIASALTAQLDPMFHDLIVPPTEFRS